MEIKPDKKAIQKNCITVFPTGLGLRKTDDDVVMIEFMEVLKYSERGEALEQVVVGSYALSKKKAEVLRDLLDQVIKVGNNDG